MIARGFKPVAWVAAVGGAALGCYMLSLNVASERAELAQIERQIIAAKQDIRQLQTELGTRGRLTQLEHWNTEVLALSAPESQQFLSNELKLASFTQPEAPVAAPALPPHLRMASADASVEPKLRTAVGSGFEAPQAAPARPMLRQASLVTADAPLAAEKKPVLVKAAAVRMEPVKKAPAAKPQAPAAKKPPMIDDALVAEIGDAVKAEKKTGGAGGR